MHTKNSKTECGLVDKKKEIWLDFIITSLHGKQTDPGHYSQTHLCKINTAMRCIKIIFSADFNRISVFWVDLHAACLSAMDLVTANVALQIRDKVKFVLNLSDIIWVSPNRILIEIS